MGRRVAIIGTGQTKHCSRREDVNQMEMVYEAATAALVDAEMTIKDIDAVVMANMELFEGRALPDMWCGEGAGAFMKHAFKISTGGTSGASGAISGYYHVASGLFDRVMVVGFEKHSDGHTAAGMALTDPLWDRQIAAAAMGNFALSISEYVAQWGVTQEQSAKVAVKARKNACNNPYAHLRINTTMEKALKAKFLSYPLRLLDLCPSSEGACAVVLASEDKAKKIASRPAWINGFTAGTTVINPGVNGVDSTYSWDTIAEKAYRMAGIDNPRKQIQVAEPYIPVSYQEIPAYSALGFCKPGEAAKLVEEGFGEMDGDIPFCPSGGTLCSNTIGAAGMARVAEAAIQVMGKGEARQVPGVKNALATAGGGLFGTGGMTAFFLDVVVLGAKPH